MIPRFRLRWLAALLLPLFLAACGRDDGADLVLLTTGGSIRKAVEAAADDFRRENPGVRVQIVTTPAKNYYVKSRAILAGRAHVDVLWMGQGFGMFATRNALLDLGPFLKKDPDFSWRDYQPEVMGWYRYGSRVYGMPYGIDLPAIAYNKDLFDAAGLPYPTSGWTLDQMLALAKKLTVPPRTGLGLRGIDYRYFDLSLLTKDNRRFALNTPAGREWLELNVKLIDREHLLTRGSDQGAIDRLSGFLNRQVAMVDVYTWDLDDLRRRAPFRWDIVALPKGRTGQRLGWASSSAFCISRRSRHPDLAWKLVRKLTGPAFQKAMFNRMAPVLQPLNAGYLQANPAPPQHVADILKMLGGMRPDPRIAEFQEIAAEWNYWMDKALLEEISPAGALAQAQTHIDRILENGRRARTGTEEAR